MAGNSCRSWPAWATQCLNQGATKLLLVRTFNELHKVWCTLISINQICSTRLKSCAVTYLCMATWCRTESVDCMLASIATLARTLVHCRWSTLHIADWTSAMKIRLPILESFVVPGSMNTSWSSGPSSGWLMTYWPANVAALAKQTLKWALAHLAALCVFQPVYQVAGSISDMKTPRWLWWYGCAFLISSLMVLAIWVV